MKLVHFNLVSSLLIHISNFEAHLIVFFPMICVAVISFCATRFQHYLFFSIIFQRIIWKSSFSPLFTEYSSQLWQYISFEHHLLRVEMHFERNYQELWRNHVETKRPNDGVVYDEFLFIRERMKLTQTIVINETVRLKSNTSFLFCYFFRFSLI